MHNSSKSVQNYRKYSERRPLLIKVPPKNIFTFRTQNIFRAGRFSGGGKTAVYSHTAICYAMRGCLKKAIAMRPNAVFCLFFCGAKLHNDGLVLTCIPGAISQRCVAFHMESEKHAVSSPRLKLPDSEVTKNKSFK